MATGSQTRKQLWNVVRGIIVAAMVLAFGYGWIHYPDAPLRACPEHGYCGKQGQPHTPEDYARFMNWVRLLVVVWPAGVAALLLIHRYGPKN